MDRGMGLPALFRRYHPVPVLAFHVVAGGLLVGYYLGVAGYVPHDNFEIYYAAAVSAFDGSLGYRPGPLSYIYQPPTVGLFVPFTILPFPVATVLWRVLNIAVLVVTGHVVIRWMERIQAAPDDPLGRPAVFATLLGGTWSLLLLLNGQVDIILAAVVWSSLYWLERGHERRAGVGIAVAASFKVFPAILGLWMLARRQYTALAASIATGVGIVASGLLLFGPAEYELYVRAIDGFRDYSDILSGVPDPNSELLSIARPIAAVSGGVPYGWFLLSGLVFLVSLFAVSYSRADLTDETHRFAVAFVTLLAAIIAFPTGQNSYTFYVIPGVVVLLYAIDRGRPKALLSAGALLLAVPVDPEELLAIREAIAPGFAPPLFDVATAVLTLASVELYGFAFILVGLASFLGGRERRPGRR